MLVLPFWHLGSGRAEQRGLVQFARAWSRPEARRPQGVRHHVLREGMVKTRKTVTLPHSPRDFLGLAIQGSTIAAAATLPVISAAAQTNGQTSMQTTTTS